MSKRVAILAGGGDVPGLNMCLKSLVYRVIDVGFEPIGVRKGWEGLIRYDYYDPTTYGDHFIELTKNIVRPIDRTPGSFLHASRIDPLETPVKLIPEFLREQAVTTQDVTGHIKDVVQRLGFKGLIVVGDDDMLNYAAHLSNEGVPLIAIPKTVHNNIRGTDYTIGFSTGLARAVSFIHELRAQAGSREQIMVVETFGAGSGLSSLMTAFLAGADRAIIPEVPYDPEKLARLALRDKSIASGNYAIITLSDGSEIVPEKILEFTPHLSPRGKSAVLRQMTAEKAKELQAQGDFALDEVVDTGSSLAGSALVAAEVLQKLIGEEVFMQSLTYLLRTGSPDEQDLLGATNFAILAARLLKAGKFGRMTAYHQRYNLTDVDLIIVTEGAHRVDIDLIGIMKVIGASSWAIARLFIGEGLILGWLSWLITLPLSLPAGRLMLKGVGATFQLDLVYKFRPSGSLFRFVIITILSVLAGGLPARGATGISARESLVYQ